MATTSPTCVPARPAGSPSSGRPPRRRASLLCLLTSLALLGLEGLGTGPAEARTSRPAATAIRFALNQLGDPYRYGATGPGAWDCSALTRAAYREAGVRLPRVSRDQYRRGPKVARPHWRPGDLVYWGRPIHHVGLYLGGRRVLHAPGSGRVVRIDRMWSSGLRSYATRPAGRQARHLLVVEPGMAGDHVRAVQQRLRANGYRVGVTGRYADETTRAVRRLQERLGWGGSGSTGPGTWHHLVRHGLRARAG